METRSDELAQRQPGGIAARDQQVGAHHVHLQDGGIKPSTK
jgi:hypothetical protein